MGRRSHSRDRGRRRDDERHGPGEHSPSDGRRSDDYRRRRVPHSRSRSRSPLPSFSRQSRRRRTPSRSHSPQSPKRRRYSLSRSRSRDKDHHSGKHDRGRSRSRSRSSESSESSDRKHRKRKKEKHRKRRSTRSRERKERKREKKEKKKKHGTPHTTEWGKHGIISEVDIFTKGPEFHTWLVEERKMNPETMSKEQNKKEFARFMEDYNTATLPHEKYYHMEAYQQRMARMRSGEFVPPPEDSYDPNADLLAHQSKLKKHAVETESYLSREQLLELRRVQHERVEVAKMKLLGMGVKQNMGVRMDGTMFDD